MSDLSVKFQEPAWIALVSAAIEHFGSVEAAARAAAPVPAQRAQLRVVGEGERRAVRRPIGWAPDDVSASGEQLVRGVRCGHCKRLHRGVDVVRACAQATYGRRIGGQA